MGQSSVQKMKSIDEHKKSEKSSAQRYLEGLKGKNGAMGQVVSIFITVLIVSVIAGMTFLFVGELKTETENTADGGKNSTAYEAVNETEQAGLTVVSFLTILFLALIFSAILTVVLRIVLPFVNLGNQMGGF